MNAPLPAAIKTTCPYCGVGCGVAATRAGPRGLIVKGDENHPANAGRLCSKGTALGNTFGLTGRLLEPKIRKNGNLEAASWDEALQAVADKFRAIIAEHGPDAVAFYVSGQLLTEDYYAVNKLAKGYIGTANVDTNSRLCMSSAVAAHKQAFGADLVPGTYEDLTEADLLIFSGHNAAWTHPVLFRRIETRTDQMRICIDPKRTDTAKSCDLHLMIKPQTDVRLWNGLCAYLIGRDAIDHDFIDQHTEGFTHTLSSLCAEDQSLEAIAVDCGISVADLTTFYDAFRKTPKTVSLFSQGSNQSVQGVNKGLSLINAHLLTGKIGKPGAAPFSITGQPNAMGGREVGGLANMLAAHMDFDAASKDRVQRFWGSPTIAPKPGLKAVDMFEAVYEGKVKAIWIMATNPMVSMPDTNRVREALDACEMVVVSDVADRTDTLDFAHIQLPAAAWGEKDGTVTNSERVISRQRALAPLPGMARPDWAIIADVARRMNPDWAEAFNWQGPNAVFDDHARLTAFENGGARFLDLGGLTGLSRAQYNILTPTRWPYPTGGQPAERLFCDGRFNTPSGRARLKVTKPQGPANPVSLEFPLSLNSARVRDHWHTLTRTALAPELNRHISEPLLDIHPKTAKKFGLKEGRLARVTTAYGEAVLKTRVTDDVREEGLSVPMHWTRVFAPFGRSNQLLNPAVDPVSGQPEFKHTPAHVSAFSETWHGFMMSPRTGQYIGMREATGAWEPSLMWGDKVIWRRTSHIFAESYEIAGIDPFDGFDALMGQSGVLSLDDPASGVTRRVRIEDGRLMGVVFIAPIHRRLPSRDWLLERFGDESLSPEDRAALLLGRLPGIEDQGRLICACRGVGQKKIDVAIAEGALTVEAIGEETGAGTSCGSCKTELKQCLIAHLKAKPQAKETAHVA
jgi:assimilatory nitrate reductase catalytic subunit